MFSFFLLLNVIVLIIIINYKKKCLILNLTPHWDISFKNNCREILQNYRFVATGENCLSYCNLQIIYFSISNVSNLILLPAFCLVSIWIADLVIAGIFILNNQFTIYHIDTEILNFQMSVADKICISKQI